MMGKRRVAANLVAAVDTVSHVRRLLLQQVDGHLVRPLELLTQLWRLPSGGHESWVDSVRSLTCKARMSRAIVANG
jgi:hypothetical protein